MMSVRRWLVAVTQNAIFIQALSYFFKGWSPSPFSCRCRYAVVAAPGSLGASQGGNYTGTKMPQLLAPKTLALWTKMLRKGTNLSQEALAAAAGLTTRTIQRVESGESSTVTTRRALARGLGYEDPDTFENPEIIGKIEKLLEEIRRLSIDAFDAQHPDTVRLPATLVSTGQQLGRLIEAANAYNFHYDVSLSLDAKLVAAEMFDYLREYNDADELYSEVQKLGTYEDLDGYLMQLNNAGFKVHSALRSTNIVGKTWEDRTPLAMSIAYVVIDQHDKDIREIMAAKSIKFGF